MKRGFLYIAATAFLFSTMEIASKLIVNEIDPFQLVFLRFLVGGLFLLPFALVDVRRQGLKLGPRDLLFFVGVGFLGVTASMSLFQAALLYAKASVVAVVFSCNTIFTSLFAVLILKERFSWRSAVAIGLGLVGVVVILNPLNMNPDFRGIALACASAVLFALFGVIGTTRVGRYGGFVLNSFSFLAGVVLLLPFLLLTHRPLVAGIDGGNIWVLLYLGVFVTGIGYACYLTAMRRTSAIETSAVFFIKPALAPLLAWAILGERPTVGMAAGVVAIVLGAGLLFRGRQAAAQKKGKSAG